MRQPTGRPPQIERLPVYCQALSSELEISSDSGFQTSSSAFPWTSSDTPRVCTCTVKGSCSEASRPDLARQKCRCQGVGPPSGRRRSHSCQFLNSLLSRIQSKHFGSKPPLSPSIRDISVAGSPSQRLTGGVRSSEFIAIFRTQVEKALRADGSCLTCLDLVGFGLASNSIMQVAAPFCIAETFGLPITSLRETRALALMHGASTGTERSQWLLVAMTNAQLPPIMMRTGNADATAPPTTSP